MSEPPRDLEALFLDQLPFVDRAAGAVARVLGLAGADADEFAAWARERLWEHDYAILRKWRGESLLTTYLATVLTNLGREFRTRRWGRWRPSAAAQRLGPVAVRLETLVVRDGHALPAAAELLRQRGVTDLSDRDLARILTALPARRRPQRVDEREVPLERLPGEAQADDVLREEEDDGERRATYAALDDALRRLPPEDQLVVRLHFLQGHTLADVARALGVPQRPLYRMKDRALAALGRELRAAGVTPAAVRDLLGGALAAPDVAAAGDGGGNSGPSGLSTEVCAPSPLEDETVTSRPGPTVGGDR